VSYHSRNPPRASYQTFDPDYSRSAPVQWAPAPAAPAPAAPAPSAAAATASLAERALKPDGTIRVANLDPSIGEEELRNDVFGDCGEIRNVTILYDRAARPMGSALITFVSVDSARRAIAEYDGASVDGRSMSVYLQCSLGPAPPVIVKRTPAPEPVLRAYPQQHVPQQQHQQQRSEAPRRPAAPVRASPAPKQQIPRHLQQKLERRAPAATAASPRKAAAGASPVKRPTSATAASPKRAAAGTSPAKPAAKKLTKKPAVAAKPAAKKPAAAKPTTTAAAPKPKMTQEALNASMASYQQARDAKAAAAAAQPSA
jgi:hypothetical protein